MKSLKLEINANVIIISPDGKNSIKMRWNSGDHAFEVTERDTDIILNTKEDYKVLYFHEKE